MDTPFVYGKIANNQDFTDRKDDVDYLSNNFKGLVNTIIISPRRWGKTSLVNEAAEKFLKNNKDYLICKVDIFNCRTEEDFYKAFSNSVLRASSTKWHDFVENVKDYLGVLAPKISVSDQSQNFDFSFGIDFQDKNYSWDEILDLPQKIAVGKKKKVIVCIDEFQNINEYENSLAFQRKLRSHWQLHDKVCYCLYGSKRHMLLDIFNNSEMPFYKFGDIKFLEKIKREDWIPFIVNRFDATGKSINQDVAALIADLTENHPYYVQQLSQQSWLRTEKKCDETIVRQAFTSIVDQLALLFSNIIDSLTSRQIKFLQAICNGEKNLSSRETLEKYNLGTSANIKNLRNSLLNKDIIEIVSKEKITIQDPMFRYWLINYYGGIF